MPATTFPEKTKQAAGAALDTAKEEIKTDAHSVGEMASWAKDKVKEVVDEAGHTAKQAGDKIQKWAGDTYEATSHAAGDFGREVTALVRKYPVPALLVGFGVGMLLGRVSRV